MSLDLEQLCRSVLGFMARAEMDAVQFAKANGLGCPPGCGDCCRDDQPEDTPLSALPGARWAVEHGLLERLEEAATLTPLGPCLFYDRDSRGHCAIYPLRPLICRLFGFSGRRDKYGHLAYSPCKRMDPPNEPGRSLPPIMSDYTIHLNGLYPPLGNDRQGINSAFWRAAEWILLHRRFDPDDTPDREEDGEQGVSEP